MQYYVCLYALLLKLYLLKFFHIQTHFMKTLMFMLAHKNIFLVGFTNNLIRKMKIYLGTDTSVNLIRLFFGIFLNVKLIVSIPFQNLSITYHVFRTLSAVNHFQSRKDLNVTISTHVCIISCMP